jgi:hypothetical protein
MDDPLAKAEFTEIKEAILADVSPFNRLCFFPRLREATPSYSRSWRGHAADSSIRSVPSGIGLTKLSSSGIADECSSP